MVMYHKASKIVKPKMDYLKVTPTMLPSILAMLITCSVWSFNHLHLLCFAASRRTSTADLKCAAGAGSQA